MLLVCSPIYENSDEDNTKSTTHSSQSSVDPNLLHSTGHHTTLGVSHTNISRHHTETSPSKKVCGFQVLLPPASAVEVIESEPFVCVCVCLCVRTLTTEPFDL